MMKLYSIYFDDGYFDNQIYHLYYGIRNKAHRSSIFLISIWFCCCCFSYILKYETKKETKMRRNDDKQTTKKTFF